MGRLRRLDYSKRGTLVVLQQSVSVSIEQLVSLNNKTGGICEQSHNEHLTLIMRGVGYQVNSLLRERLGMADAQNLELNRRLEESHTAVERVTLALPAPVVGAGPRRPVWRFWEW